MLEERNSTVGSFRKTNQKTTEFMGFPGGTGVKNLPANARDTGLISGPGRSHMPRSN